MPAPGSHDPSEGDKSAFSVLIGEMCTMQSLHELYVQEQIKQHVWAFRKLTLDATSFPSDEAHYSL